MGEIRGGRFRLIVRADKDLRAVQFVGHDLKHQPRIRDEAVLVCADKLLRASRVCADVPRVLIVVVATPNPKRKSDLPQIVYATDTQNPRLISVLVPLPAHIKAGRRRKRDDDGTSNSNFNKIHRVRR